MESENKVNKTEIEDPTRRRSEAERLRYKLQETEWKMWTSGEQVVVLYRKLQELEEKLVRAIQENHCSRMHTLRLRQVTLEGVRSVYRLYARTKLDEMLELQKKVEQLDDVSDANTHQ